MPIYRALIISWLRDFVKYFGLIEDSSLQEKPGIYKTVQSHYNNVSTHELFLVEQFGAFIVNIVLKKLLSTMLKASNLIFLSCLFPVFVSQHINFANTFPYKIYLFKCAHNILYLSILILKQNLAIIWHFPWSRLIYLFAWSIFAWNFFIWEVLQNSHKN